MTNGKPSNGDPVTSGTDSQPQGHPSRGSVLCPTSEATRALGARFAAGVAAGAVLSLEGALGAGKTQFAKGFAAALGYKGEVSSPTFTLVHEYAGEKGVIIHFDLYRLDEADEVAGLGWTDYLDSGETLLVEWGDKFPELLPDATWRLRFQIEGTARLVQWEQMK